MSCCQRDTSGPTFFLLIYNHLLTQQSSHTTYTHGSNHTNAELLNVCITHNTIYHLPQSSASSFFEAAAGVAAEAGWSSQPAQLPPLGPSAAGADALLDLADVALPEREAGRGMLGETLFCAAPEGDVHSLSQSLSAEQAIFGRCLDLYNNHKGDRKPGVHVSTLATFGPFFMFCGSRWLRNPGPVSNGSQLNSAAKP